MLNKRTGTHVSPQAHQDLLATAISLEMGAPIKLARNAQVPSGLMHLTTTLDVLKVCTTAQHQHDPYTGLAW
jgi:aldehyde dehydrogenase (NAD+)